MQAGILRKTLQLLRVGIPALLEWLKSPIVYRADPEFALLFGHLATEFQSPERLFQHYLSMARGNARDYLRGNIVRLKKYFYVLRRFWRRAGSSAGADRCQ